MHPILEDSYKVLASVFLLALNQDNKHADGHDSAMMIGPLICLPHLQTDYAGLLWGWHIRNNMQKNTGWYGM